MEIEIQAEVNTKLNLVGMYPLVGAHLEKNVNLSLLFPFYFLHILVICPRGLLIKPAWDLDCGVDIRNTNVKLTE